MKGSRFGRLSFACAWLFLVGLALAGPRLDEVSFLAVHNAFQECEIPSEMIRDFGVWEVELDFGQRIPGYDLEIGHEGPCKGETVCGEQPDHGFGCLLKDWFANIRDGSIGLKHPVLVKLEVATQCPCDWAEYDCYCELWLPFCWTWPKVTHWGPEWKSKFREALSIGFGDENIFSPADLEAFRSNNPGSMWPEVEQLAGKFLISIQSKNPEYISYIEDASPLVFVLIPPGKCGNNEFRTPFCGQNPTESRNCLSEAAGLNHPSPFFGAVRSNINRLILDSVYTKVWSHLCIHPPIPSHIQPPQVVLGEPLYYSNSTGTIGYPFRSLGHAVQAGWIVPVLPEGPLGGEWGYNELAIQSGIYPEKIIISKPVTLTALNGPVTIGGNRVTYTVHVQVPENPSNGWTDGEVSVTVLGNNGSFSCRFSGGDGSENGFTNPGVRRCFASTPEDIGVIQSAQISNPGHEGFFDCIYVDSSTTGRYYIPIHEWVEPAVTKNVAAHWD